MLYRGLHHHVIQSPPINLVSLSHIVGVPNHIRVWRRDVYHQAGGHNHNLTVADDYELIIRTLFHTKAMRIAELTYIQYINDSWNNFTFSRNKMIQYLVSLVEFSHREQLHKTFSQDIQKYNQHLQCYYQCDKCPDPINLVYKPGDKPNEPLISIVMPTFKRKDNLRKAILSVIKQKYHNWELIIVGDKCPVLESFMTSNPFPQKIMENKIRWFNLSKNHGAGGTVPRNYALKMIVRTEWVAYLDDDNTWTEDHLSKFVNIIKSDKDVQYIFSSFCVAGKPIICREPLKGRLDTSSICHRRSLLDKYGYWKTREEVGYAHDFYLFNQWKDEKYVATEKCTMHYSTDFNEQSFESILNMVQDENVTKYKGIK